MVHAVDQGRLRVGSWPGPKFSRNSFVQSFCEGLSALDIEIVDVHDPRTQSPEAIDILHIHWPEQPFWAEKGAAMLVRRIADTVAALRRLRDAGVRIVWTVHNLRPHDLPVKNRLVWLWYRHQLCQLVDGFVTLSPGTLPLVRKELAGLREKPGIVAWHPPYKLSQPTISRSKIREELDVPEDAHLFAFLGLVRPYKGVEELIHAFRRLPSKRYALVIAGEALSWRYEKKVRRAAAKDDRIRLVLRRLPDDEFINLGAAADVHVLPFLRYLHSGSLIHAVSQHRAVLTPHTAFSDNLSETVGGDWVQRYTAPLTAEALQSAQAMSGAPCLEALSRDASSQSLNQFYRSALGRELAVPRAAEPSQALACAANTHLLG